MSTYEAWRATYQDAELAAKAAFEQVQGLAKLVDGLQGALGRQVRFGSVSDAAASELRRLHAENQELKEQMAAIGAGGVEPLRGSRQAHECREALAACINLLRKTPKITRDIYVGKDRQAWGVQAKAVLDAALAALNQKDEK